MHGDHIPYGIDLSEVALIMTPIGYVGVDCIDDMQD